MRLIRWVLGVVLVALAGCAIHPERDEGVTMVAPDAAARWVLDGRIGVQGGPQAIQASLIWEHDARQERLRLSGPLSQGLVSVVAQGDVLLINEGEGAQTVYRNPDQALRERLGVPVPLVSLKYWVLGIPDPAAESKPMGGKAIHFGFEQAGWRVTPSEPKEVGAWRLPGRLVVEGHGVKLKIVIDEWRVGV